MHNLKLFWDVSILLVACLTFPRGRRRSTYEKFVVGSLLAMALLTDRLSLNNHELFRKIRGHLPSKQTKTKNLMVCNDDMLFVWDPVDECLLTLYLRTPDSGHQSHQVRLGSPLFLTHSNALSSHFSTSLFKTIGLNAVGYVSGGVPLNCLLQYLTGHMLTS